MASGERPRVAVIDAGGRGAALMQAYGRSDVELFGFPGNDWMKHYATERTVETFPKIGVTATDEIVKKCLELGITLVDVCQDNAVERGTVNALRQQGILTVGPTREAGEVEWSKAKGREVAAAAGVRQPNYRVFDSTASGLSYLTQIGGDSWVKADGLAEGKAALPARNREEAKDAIIRMSAFGDAGRRFLIEDWVRSDDGSPGREFSAFAICDGTDYKMLGIAQDYKRINAFDEGPNTGSMGSTAMVELGDRVAEQVYDDIGNMLKELSKGRTPYNGIFYYSGMVVKRNGKDESQMIEINSRWGDPEIQAILPGIDSNWLDVSMAVARGNLNDIQISHDGDTRVVVTLASRGYPGNYDAVRGKEIFGVDDARVMPNVEVFGAGVTVDDEGRLIASGGRLLYVVGNGNDIIDARANAYGAMSMISVDGNNGHYRHDIGWQEVAKVRR